MSWIQRIRLLIHQNSLKSAIARNQQLKHKSSISLKAANTVGILFDATELKDRDIVLAFAKKIKQEGKNVKLLAYLDDFAESDSYPFRIYSKKNLDWFFRPKGDEINAFTQEPFDLLLYFHPLPNPHAEYIMTLSKATFKVGPVSKNTHAYDLMIDAGSKPELSQFIKQAELLLEKMNPTNTIAHV
ncbi:MAG TPA: hypothetical protein PKA00_05210 [Saprospiraceae bacterium]|nr:hypothetical protein [Saprospiraceae bacterium]HMQ82281.1 hypothetical protein [Saprospiraceae bacterium]